MNVGVCACTVPLLDNTVLYHNLQTQEQYFKISRCLQLGLDLTLLCKVTGHNKILQLQKKYIH